MASSNLGAVITGAEYVSQITALKSDRRARQAFRSLALHLTRPGSRLLDFGAGTGMDARFYAENGLTVATYDVDSKMCEFCRDHCRDLIEAGRVSVNSGSYADFLARGLSGRRVDLVTSNFAPLNLIEDLQPLFAKFDELTAPGGQLLASVINPTFLGDFRYAWWWRNILQLWRRGHYSVQGAQASIVRRRVANFASQCEPHFTLRRVFCGLAPYDRPDLLPREVTGDRFAALRATRCQFIFLLFEKRPKPL